jgi:predicted negative regulator of RcsB-dependent stress response
MPPRKEKSNKLTTPQATAKQDPVERAIEWINKHRNPLIVAAAILVVVALSTFLFITSQQRKEAFAAAELENARAVAAAGNLALAASDLSQLVDTYGGTLAAEEALIVLAQLRLTEGQPAAAMVELRKLLDSGPSSQFVAPAHGLLANALEQAGNPTEAAQQYLLAAEAAWYDFLAAQYLLDAARAFATASDSAGAIATLERIVAEFGDTDMSIEAQVRLNELLPGGR